MCLMTDKSHTAVGAVLQQHIDNSWQPISYFSRKLKPAETQYSTFHWELLAVYLSIKYFRHFVEARLFHVSTDNKPLTFSFSLFISHSDQYSPQQIRHLDFISQFTSDVRYVKDTQNFVADALLRVEANPLQQDIRPLVQFQRDGSSSTWRPRTPSSTVLFIFTYSGTHTPTNVRHYNFVTPLLVYPALLFHLSFTVQCLIPFTLSLILEYKPLNTSSLLSLFGLALTLMLGGGLAPVCPVDDENVARAFLDCWISCFGISPTVTTDRGQQFHSSLWRYLMPLLGSTRLCTTAYHPIANGLIKCFRRQLKAALKSYPHPNSWTDSLSMYSLVFESHWNKMLAAVQLSLYIVLLFVYLVNSSRPLPKTIWYRTPLTMSINSNRSCNNYNLHLLVHTPIVPPTSVITTHMFLYVVTQFANPCNNPMMVHLRYLNELISTSQWTSKVDRKLSQLITLNLLIARWH